MNKEVLTQGFFEFLDGGLEEEKKQRFRLATTAYFKAISQLIDLLVFRRTGFIPKNHTERFRIIERENRQLYLALDSAFKIYRDTYTSQITRQTCISVKHEIPKIIEFGRLEEEFKEALRKIQNSDK